MLFILEAKGTHVIGCNNMTDISNYKQNLALLHKRNASYKSIANDRKENINNHIIPDRQPSSLKYQHYQVLEQVNSGKSLTDKVSHIASGIVWDDVVAKSLSSSQVAAFQRMNRQNTDLSRELNDSTGVNQQVSPDDSAIVNQQVSPDFEDSKTDIDRDMDKGAKNHTEESVMESLVGNSYGDESFEVEGEVVEDPSQSESQSQVLVAKTLQFEDSTCQAEDDSYENNYKNDGGGRIRSDSESRNENNLGNNTEYESDDELIILREHRQEHGQYDEHDQVQGREQSLGNLNANVDSDAEEDHLLQGSVVDENNVSEFIIHGAEIGHPYEAPHTGVGPTGGEAGVEGDDYYDDDGEEVVVAHIKSTTTPFLKPRQPKSKLAAGPGLLPKMSEEVPCSSGGGMSSSVVHSTTITPSRIIMPTEKHQTRPLSPTRSKNESDFGRKLLSQRQLEMEMEMGDSNQVQVEGGGGLYDSVEGDTDNDDGLMFDRCSIASSLDGLARRVEITSQKATDPENGFRGGYGHAYSSHPLSGLQEVNESVAASLSNSDSATVVVHTRTHVHGGIGIGIGDGDRGGERDGDLDVDHIPQPKGGYSIQEDMKSYKDNKTDRTDQTSDTANGSFLNDAKGSARKTTPQQKISSVGNNGTPASAKDTPGSKSHSQNQNRSRLSSSTALTLGDEWKEALTPGTNKRYYYNRRTRESSWKLPKDAIYVKYEDNTFGIFVPKTPDAAAAATGGVDSVADHKKTAGTSTSGSSASSSSAKEVPVKEYSTPQRPVSSSKGNRKQQLEEEQDQNSATKASHSNNNSSIISTLNASGLPPHPASSARKQQSHRKAEYALNHAINMTRQVLFSDTSIMDASGVQHRSPGLTASPGDRSDGSDADGDSATRRRRRQREARDQGGQLSERDPQVTSLFAGNGGGSNSWSVLEEDEEIGAGVETGVGTVGVSSLQVARERLRSLRENQSNNQSTTAATQRQLYQLVKDGVVGIEADNNYQKIQNASHTGATTVSGGSDSGSRSHGLGIASESVLSVDDNTKRLIDTGAGAGLGTQNYDASYILDERNNSTLDALDALYDSTDEDEHAHVNDRSNMQKGKDLIALFNSGRRGDVDQEQSLELSVSHAPCSNKLKPTSAGAENKRFQNSNVNTITPAAVNRSRTGSGGSNGAPTTGAATVVQSHRVDLSKGEQQLEFTPLTGVDLSDALGPHSDVRRSDPLNKTQEVSGRGSSLMISPNPKSVALHHQLQIADKSGVSAPATVDVTIAHARVQPATPSTAIVAGSGLTPPTAINTNTHTTRRQLFNEDSKASATPLIYCCFCGEAVTCSASNSNNNDTDGDASGLNGLTAKTLSITDMVARHVERDCEMCFGKSSAVVEEVLGALELGFKRAGVLNYKCDLHLQDRNNHHYNSSNYRERVPFKSPAKFVNMVASPIATNARPFLGDTANVDADVSNTTVTAVGGSGGNSCTCPVCGDRTLHTHEELISHMKVCLFQVPAQSALSTLDVNPNPNSNFRNPAENAGDTTTIITTACPFCSKSIPKTSSLSSHFLSCAKKKEKLHSLATAHRSRLVEKSDKPDKSDRVDRHKERGKDSLVKEVLNVAEKKSGSGSTNKPMLSQTVGIGGKANTGSRAVAVTPMSVGNGNPDDSFTYHPTPISNHGASSGIKGAGSSGKHGHSASKVWR